MNILHISNGYAESKVHSNLCKSLDNLGIEQTIYCPVRNESLLGNNQFDGNNVKFVFSFCIKPWYKYVYHYKSCKLYHDMKNKIELGSVDVIHAATLFSDGSLAYKAYKEFGIPYIVAVRNTDFNYFIRFMRHTYPMGHSILLNARKIIFISAGIKKQFEGCSFVKPILHVIKDKFVLQPNGIDSYWLSHISYENRAGHNILYIGDFSDNKNVERLINSVLAVRSINNFKDCHLTIIGGGKNKTDKVERLIKKHEDCVTYLGKIYEKDLLASIMRENTLFAMPSIFETFGLVYLEALSQNLPVIYTKGQGIDGLFDNTVGIAVSPYSIEDIKNAIIRIFESSNYYNNSSVDFNLFSWDIIANNYIRLYKSAL